MRLLAVAMLASIIPQADATPVSPFGERAYRSMYVALLHREVLAHRGRPDPRPLVALNTGGPDYAASLSGDGQWLFYPARSLDDAAPHARTTGTLVRTHAGTPSTTTTSWA